MPRINGLWVAKLAVSAVALSVAAHVSCIATVQAAPRGVELLAPEVNAPDTRFLDARGSATTIRDFKGRTVVLNVWATWCAPCIKEMPSLDRLATKLDAKDAVVLAVSQDKGGIPIAMPFLEKLGIQNLPPYADPSGKLTRELGIRGLPTTFIISASGAIVGRVEGSIKWDSLEMVEFIAAQAERE